MSSLIPGYNYDIFVSYRQKDNKGERWVSEFVEALKTELESTFKEEISVYFDINPHDGLLETHDVDASLKEKLKCLVFIPIISRTYCDPKSFAWEHEFKAFVDQASKDQFGLKIKLPNGNVASRVLPVRIHDLDNSDIKECESVLGGVLRGIDFIYKESGIDKPLTADDDEKKNLNNTKYRIQVIKVAHAVKEIILGMKAEPVPAVKEKPLYREPSEEIKKEEIAEEEKKPVKVIKTILLSAAAIVALLLIAGIIAYPKIFKRDTLERLRSSGEKISVVVFPFQNLTNDTLLNVWQDGIQDFLITSFSNSEELTVKQREHITGLLQSQGLTKFAPITPSVASKISKKLDANVFIYGTITKESAKIRLSGQLTNSKTGYILKSFAIEGTADKIMHTIDSLSGMIKDYLVLSKLEKDLYKGLPPSLFSKGITNSPEAYRNYIDGMNALRNGDPSNAVKWFSKAVSMDTTFNMAYISLILAYQANNELDLARKLCSKLYEKRDQMPPKQQVGINWANAWLNETPYEEIKYTMQMLESDNQDPITIRNLGDKYFLLNQFDKAIPYLKNALEIYNKWGTKPLVYWNYTYLGIAYHNTGQYRKERRLYKKAEQDFPDNQIIINRQAILSLTEKDTITANKYIDKYISLRKGDTEVAITISVAGIYSQAGILNRAERYYRQALSLDPKNAYSMNSLAYFLIDNNININEGMELIDKALKINPNNYSYLHTKGWGLYKQDKYQEALEILQKSWELRKKNALYNHTAFAHLDSAEKAVARLK